MDDDLKTIAVWWAGWTILDWIWKYFLGATLLSLGGWLLAYYRSSSIQKEVRGAAIGISIMTVLTMALALSRRPETVKPSGIEGFIGGGGSPQIPTREPMPVPSASVQVEDWNQPASGHGGPIGPIVTVELVQAFVSLPKPCIIRLTSPPNSELAKTISWILAHGAPTGGEICRVDDAPPGPPNVDVTSSAVEPTKEPGIVVHWDEDFNPGNYIAHLLDSDGFKVSISHRLPANAAQGTIWLDIGPGSPWK
jgi:hypothetical protein